MMKLLTLYIINQNILKFNDYVMLSCKTFCLLMTTRHNTLPLSLQNIFIPVTNIHEHNTRNATQNIYHFL